MALQDIIQSINDDAKVRVAKLQREGKAQATKARQAWEQELELKRDEIKARWQAEADSQASQELIKLKTSQQQAVLQAKQDLLDKVLANSLEQLGSLPDEQYINWLAQALRGSPSHEGELSSTTGKTLLLKKAMERAGRKFTLGAEELTGSGGFICRSENMAVDSRFEKILENKKADLRVEVGQLLFAELNEITETTRPAKRDSKHRNH